MPQIQMSPEVDTILETAENALTEAACSDNLQTRRTIIEDALRQAKRLEEIAPDYFNTFHVQGVLWYHHPDKTSERSQQAKHYLIQALRLNPKSQLTIHYLGCIHFDEGDFSGALGYFSQTDRQYWETEGKRWRWLKAWECQIVCKARMDINSVSFCEIRKFTEACMRAHQAEYADPAVPFEVWSFVTSDYARSHPEYARIRSHLEKFVEDIDHGFLLSPYSHG